MNRLRLTEATTSASAWAMSVPGWKYSLSSVIPWTFLLSTWSMPFTYRKWNS